MRDLTSTYLLGVVLAVLSVLPGCFDTGNPKTQERSADEARPLSSDAKPASEASPSEPSDVPQEESVVQTPPKAKEAADRQTASEERKVEQEEAEEVHFTDDALARDLRELLEHEDALVRIASACSLMSVCELTQLDPEPGDLETLRRDLEELAGDENAAMGRKAQDVLDKFRQHREEYRATGFTESRYLAVLMQPTLGTRMMLRLLRVDSPVVRRYSALFFFYGVPFRWEQIPTNEIVPALTGLLQERHEETRAAGACALGSLGPDASAALPELERLLLDSEDRALLSIAVAVGKIDPGSRKATRAVVSLLESDDDQLQLFATRAFCDFEPLAEVAVPALIGLIVGGERSLVKYEAMKALKHICALGKIGPEAVPALIEALRDEDPCARREARLLLDMISTKHPNSIE